MKTIKPYEILNKKQQVEIVKEVDISETEQVYKVAEKVRKELRDNYAHLFSKSLLSEKARDQVKQIIAGYIKENTDLHITGVSLQKLIETVQHEVVSLGPIQKALDNPDITNIDINTPKDVFVEENGEERYAPEYGFQSEQHLLNVIQKLLIPIGRSLSANEPVIDSLYPDGGFRICVTQKASDGGISTYSPTVSLRKFPDKTITPLDLVQYKSISNEIHEFYRDVVETSNIVVAGSTNSGKTTKLTAILQYLHENTRIITIEDSPELMLRTKDAFKNYKNIIAFQAKHHEKKEKAYDIARLTVTSLRKRPHKIVIGEVRSSESAQQALVAMNTGHVAYMTIHASSAKETAIRLLQLCGNDEAIAAQLGANIDLIIFQEKRKKSRIVTEIIELKGYKGVREPEYTTLFKFVQEGVNEDGYIKGQHVRVGAISENLAEKLRANLVPEERVQRWLTPPNNIKGVV